MLSNQNDLALFIYSSFFFFLFIFLLLFNLKYFKPTHRHKTEQIKYKIIIMREYINNYFNIVREQKKKHIKQKNQFGNQI